MSDFNGALEEVSRGFKCEHRRSACQNSASVRVHRGDGRRLQKDQNASAHSLIAIQGAVDEVGRSRDVGPAALHAELCNQSRNVPAGRWKKGPEVQNASAYIYRSFVVKDVAIDEVGR